MPSSTPALATPSTPSFATGFGYSLFYTLLSQQQQTPLFQKPSSGGFGFNFRPARILENSLHSQIMWAEAMGKLEGDGELPSQTPMASACAGFQGSFTASQARL
ncbi:hypothetical protein L1049_010414 [Liquidambar formosana]|uniref:Uncharacterized protein n=1 Tax=Liquidambar formosana TaxID=63359 RepID=A0AAP0N7I3_LIQFO